MYLTSEELKISKVDSMARLVLPVTIQDVHFSEFLYRIQFRYKNASGLIFTDNGYVGEQLDGKNYYLLWKLSCKYSNDSKFNPSFSPDLQSAASAVISSWKLFTKI